MTVAGLERRLELWLQRRRRRRLMRQYGGIQWCPWCKQCAQEGPGRWGFSAEARNARYDVLTCSVCGGTSRWEWGMGMHFINRITPGPTDWPTGLAGSKTFAAGASASEP